MDLDFGDELVIDLERLGDITELLKMLNDNKDYLVETNNGKTIYSLNANSKQDLKDLLKRIEGGEEINMSDSNERLIFINKKNQSFKLKLRKPKKDIFKQGKWLGSKNITKTKNWILNFWEIHYPSIFQRINRNSYP